MTEIIERKLTPEEIAEQATREAQQHQIDIDAVTAQRLAAYQQESDPIYMEAQRDPSRTIAEWEAKIEEIKKRYPYPAEPKASK